MIQAKSKINDRIEQLERELENVKGRETEKYARIVGYYRAVKNWNKGKREEYKFRVNFSQTDFNTDINGTVEMSSPKSEKPESVKSTDKIASYVFFFRTKCPNCPPVKAIINTLEIPGEKINADKSEGFTKAAQFEVFTAPTVIFLDKKGVEVTRTSDVKDIKQLLDDKRIL